jgi:hypothetical protein
LENAANITSFHPFHPQNHISGFLGRLVGIGAPQQCGTVTLPFENISPEDFDEVAFDATSLSIRSIVCVATTFSLFSGDHPGQSIVTLD